MYEATKAVLYIRSFKLIAWDWILLICLAEKSVNNM